MCLASFRKDSAMIELNNLSCFANFTGFSKGFLGGIILGFSAILIIAGTIYRRQKRKHNQGISIKKEGGNLFIAESAIRQLIRRTISNFPNVALNTVVIQQKKENLIFKISIDLLPETSISPLIEDIRNKLGVEIKEYTGIEESIIINISIHSYSANPKRIDKQAKKAGNILDESQIVDVDNDNQHEKNFITD